MTFPGNSVPVCISQIQLPDKKKQALATLLSHQEGDQYQDDHISPLAAPLSFLHFQQIQQLSSSFCALSPLFLIVGAQPLGCSHPSFYLLHEMCILTMPRRVRALPRFLTPLCSLTYLFCLPTYLPFWPFAPPLIVYHFLHFSDQLPKHLPKSWIWTRAVFWFALWIWCLSLPPLCLVT